MELEVQQIRDKVNFKEKNILHIKATSASVVNENIRSNDASDSVEWRYFMLSETQFLNDF